MIYVQGEHKQVAPEKRTLDAPLTECRELAAKVQRGPAKLIGTHVEMKPPNLLAKQGGGAWR